MLLLLLKQWPKEIFKSDYVATSPADTRDAWASLGYSDRCLRIMWQPLIFITATLWNLVELCLSGRGHLMMYLPSHRVVKRSTISFGMHQNDC